MLIQVRHGKGAATRERWLADRQADLLPVPYFHIVFTVPAEVAEIAFHNKAIVYGILFCPCCGGILRITATLPRWRAGPSPPQPDTS